VARAAGDITRTDKGNRDVRRQVALLVICLLVPAGAARADAGPVILAKSREALIRLLGYSGEAGPLLEQARGVLVFPEVINMGFAVSGQFGEGVLLIADQPEAYYVTAGAPWGLPLEARSKSEVILFMTDQSLARFRDTHGWEVGVDSSVALVGLAVDGSVHRLSGTEPVIGFVFSEAGLQQGLSMEGSRIVQIAR
jgi:lipid-binding SYLF domain-containing protein